MTPGLTGLCRGPTLAGMTEQPARDEDDEIPVHLARLRNAIACELHAQLALRCETINLADVPEVAYAVAARLGRAFRIEWAPPWEADREDDDSLGLDGAVFYGSGRRDERDQGPPDRYPIFDHGWPPLPR
jgi:hypothetical protein